MRRFLSAALLGCCCLISGDLSAQTPYEPENAVVFIEVFTERLNPSTGLQERTKVSEGSGFVINDDGWIATAKHLVDIEVSEGTTLIFEGSLRSRYQSSYKLMVPPVGSTAADVTLLRFPRNILSSFQHFCLVEYPDLENGQALSGMGFPLGDDFSARPGVVTSRDNGDGLVQTNMGLARGMSGGPVVDSRGYVVGMIQEGRSSTNSFDYFILNNYAHPLFRSAPAAYVPDCDLGEKPEAIIKTVSFSEMLNNSSSFNPHRRHYTLPLHVEPGFEIVGSRLNITSQNNAENVVVDILPDGTSGTISFDLEADPVAGQDRGWLDGKVFLELQPMQ